MQTLKPKTYKMKMYVIGIIYTNQTVSLQGGNRHKRRPFSPHAYEACQFQNVLSAWPNEGPKQLPLLGKSKHLEGEKKISTEICNQVIQYSTGTHQTPPTHWAWDTSKNKNLL